MLISTFRQKRRGLFMTLGGKTRVFLFVIGGLLVAAGANATPYRVLGQPTLTNTMFASRCPSATAQFSFSNAGGFNMYGPSGIVVDPRGRIYVTDFGGRRVLTWPNVNALQSCQSAESVIGANDLSGPEAVAIDFRSQTAPVFVADTLNHTVKIYQRTVVGTWARTATLGTPGIPGNAMNQFNFPRGLAFDSTGRLFVADDFNKRILIFSPPFTNGKAASDSIGAFANGGFAGPKGLAMIGNTLFVSDYYNNRVLRFTGPFTTPDQVYMATGSFTGLFHPIDLAVHPDGSLLVTDQGNTRIARYSNAVWSGSQAAPTSVFSDYMNPEPLGIAVDQIGRLYIADYRAFRVLIRDEYIKRTPISSVNSLAARTLLADLHSRPNRTTDRVAIGQQLITYQYGLKINPYAWYGDWLQLEQIGLPLPEVMGGELSDLMSYPGFYPNQNAFNELVRHGQMGHIVTLVWHPSNPTFGSFNTPISTADLRNMINDGTAVGQRWRTELNRAAAVLQQFANAGVPVFFRPLHEQNGDFFWWGHNGSTGTALRERQAAWVMMWRDLVLELTTRKGLNNLLFVFGTNQVNYNGVAAPLTYYPGGLWADVVSIDVYNNNLNLAGNERGIQHYTALIGTGKPFGLAEFGQSFTNAGTTLGVQWDARTLLSRINDTYPRTAFAVAWYSSAAGGVPYIFALPDVSYTPILLQHPLIDTQWGEMS